MVGFLTVEKTTAPHKGLPGVQSKRLQKRPLEMGGFSGDGARLVIANQGHTRSVLYSTIYAQVE
jgi:hypothetical protein